MFMIIIHIITICYKVNLSEMYTAGRVRDQTVEIK